MNNHLYLHIGFHKTGSTWLQDKVFPAFPGVQYLGIGGQKALSPWLRWLRDSELHEPMPNFDMLSNSKVNKFLYSDERLSGHMMTGSGAGALPLKIKNLPVDVSVIIVVRNQADMYESVYRQYIWEGGELNFLKFSNLDGVDRDILWMNRLDYYSLIKFYQNTLGSNRVLVLAYEQLKQDPIQFLKEITDFIGIKDIDHNIFLKIKGRNVSVGFYEHTLLRLFNIFARRFLSNGQKIYLSRLIKKALACEFYFFNLSAQKKFGSMQFRSKILSHFKESNLELARNFPKINFKKYGYFN